MMHVAPTITQYSANQTNLPFLTIFNIQLQARHPTINADRNPITIADKPTGDWTASDIADSGLIKSSTACPKMGITTIKKENCATCSRLSPRIIPVAIVVPERLKPGKTAIA